MQYSDLLAEVPDERQEPLARLEGEAAATDDDGSSSATAPTSGREAICYRSDLFAAPACPTDPRRGRRLFDGDWDNYFDVGDAVHGGDRQGDDSTPPVGTSRA